MIKVLLPAIPENGGRWECSNCHCVFNYDKEDIQKAKTSEYYNYYDLKNYNIIYIKCPMCGNTRVLNTKYNKV